MLQVGFFPDKFISRKQTPTALETTQMTTLINGKTFTVKQTGAKFFYWSPRALRWLPVAASKVTL